MIKRIGISLLALFVMVSLPVFATGMGEEAPKLSAQSAVLYDTLTGTALLEVNADRQMGMASTTKIMTALVALEQYDPEAVVEIKPEWCYVEGSSIYLQPGERLKILDLLYGMMLKSGNDAATAIAGLYSGRVEDFVALMNEKAAELGLADTHFDNPSGLDGETHYSTAMDMAQLTAYALENDLFAQIVSTKSITAGGRYLTNHNKLLKYVEGAIGVKTGFTKATGRCLVSAVRREGRTLVVVTLNAPNDWSDHQAMYTWGFAGKTTRTLMEAGQIGNIPAASAEKSAIGLMVGESLSLNLDDEEMAQLDVVLCGPRIWYGGAEEGQVYGRVEVRLGQRVIASVPITFAETVAEIPPEKGFWERLMGWLSVKQ